MLTSVEVGSNGSAARTGEGAAPTTTAAAAAGTTPGTAFSSGEVALDRRRRTSTQPTSSTTTSSPAAIATTGRSELELFDDGAGPAGAVGAADVVRLTVTVHAPVLSAT